MVNYIKKGMYAQWRALPTSAAFGSPRTRCNRRFPAAGGAAIGSLP
jgi:hypothetical protein